MRTARLARPCPRPLQSPHGEPVAPNARVRDDDRRLRPSTGHHMNRMTIDRALTLAAHAAIVVFVVAWLIEHY